MNEEYRMWLRSWPCWVCFRNFCEEHGYDVFVECRRPEVRALAYALITFDCGLTQVAHVGMRGLAQKCPDREAIPLGQKHHIHPTAGGGPESHHALGKSFWTHHNLNRQLILDCLQNAYRDETGKEA